MTARQPDTEGDASYPSQLIPVALLLGVTIVGLIGAVASPRWTGPLHGQAEVIGIVLEVALAVLLIVTFRLRGESSEVALRLRGGLKALLPAMMVALLIALLVGLHLHWGGTVHVRPPVAVTPPSSHPKSVGGAGKGGFPIWILWVLGIVALLAAVALALKLSVRRPRPRVPRAGGLAVDPEELKTALDEGAAALRASDYDDARKAIIACYVAMERRLGDKNDAETPDELLARATRDGLIHGPAAGRLTGLFYEARFSTHPLGDDKREQALAALDEMRSQT
jgi:Domain of unknown function (DUF4129)